MGRTRARPQIFAVRAVTSSSSRRAFLKFGLCSASSLLIAQSFPQISSAAPREAMSLLRRMRFNLQFHNPAARTLENQIFRSYLPLNSATQKLVDVKVSMPWLLRDDALGHQILELSFERAHGFFKQVVSLETTIELTVPSARLTLPNPSIWLTSERFVESDHPDIMALAQTLQRESKKATLEAIYDWVIGHMEHTGYFAEDFGALYALHNRRGDCTEYANLVVALARASHIPARTIGGYVTEHDVASKPKDYHDWSEIFLDDNWRVIDAQKQRFFPDNRSYIGFRIHREKPDNSIGSNHRYLMLGELQVTFR